MAEVTAIFGLANAGFKLSMTLFSFAEAVRTVDKEVLRTATDITLFSQVLKLLAVTLDRGRRANIISPDAFETSAQIAEECRTLFNEFEAVINKSTNRQPMVRMAAKEDVVSAEEKVKVTMPFTKRVMNLFLDKGRVDALRRHLESLKTNLRVMLGILNFAESVAASNGQR